MKKTLKWILELTLTQQLLVIILIFTISFCTFFFLLLGRNIDEFVEDQMFRILELSQNDIIFSYTQNIPITTLVKRQDTNMGHVILTKPNMYIIGSLAVDEHLMNRMLAQASDQVIPAVRYSYRSGGSTIYYMIRRLSSDEIFVSYMYESLGNQVRDTLLSNIINITVFVVFILFILLLLWVASIIQPLKQIRTYIDRLKVGQRAELRIMRQDEIGDLANALVGMKVEMDYQESLKNELIHNISHDLKTPIATIKSYGESIKDGIYPYDTLEKSVDVIIEHAGRLEKKVQSLLLLNRLSYVESEQIEMVNVDMVAIIQQVLLAIKVIKPNIQIDVNLIPCTFKGNEENWRVAVENIIDNALRYARTAIRISLKKDELIIENDGPAISEASLHSIFKAYEKGTDGNFGLGLSIVYKIVTKFGYFVVAENYGGGVRFRIYNAK